MILAFFRFGIVIFFFQPLAEQVLLASEITLDHLEGEQDGSHSDLTGSKNLEIESDSVIHERRKPGAYFGFGLSKPSDLGSTNHFESMYGDKPNFVSLQAGYYIATYILDFGIFSKASYFHADGRPLKATNGLDFPFKDDLPASIQVDKTQRLELTLVPLDLTAELALSPFNSRRVVLRAWVGYQKSFVQEVLKPDLPATVSEANQTNYIQKGWNSGKILGAAFSIALNGIEPRSDYALRSLGIDRTYISPFMEIVTTTEERMGNFDRKTYGVSFNFESLR